MHKGRKATIQTAAGVGGSAEEKEAGPSTLRDCSAVVTAQRAV